MTQLYVGGFSHSNDGALHVFDYDQRNGHISHRSTTTTVVNPAFLVLHPRANLLYAVSEISGGKGGPHPTGMVATLAIDSPSGELRLVNQQSSMGPTPCHITVDAAGRLLFVANHYGPSVVVFRIDPNGDVGPPTAIVTHQGSGSDATRQQCAQPHSCLVDPTNRLLYVADLGVDRIMLYDIDFDNGHLTPHNQCSVSVRPGSGPRHFTFHPSGRSAYVTNEMGGTVTVFAVDQGTGALREVQDISTLPEGYDGLRWNSEIVVAPSGRFLYAGNRGHDSIAIFAVDATSGRLTVVGHQPTHGKTPRHFALDPAGRRLIVGNQHSDTLVVFDIDERSGTLTRGSEHSGVANPVCLLFDDRGERTSL